VREPDKNLSLGRTRRIILKIILKKWDGENGLDCCGSGLGTGGEHL
jgi:hypothetical protein